MTKKRETGCKHVVNMTVDDKTDELLETMARAETEGNRSQMVRKLIREGWKRREEHKE